MHDPRLSSAECRYPLRRTTRRVRCDHPCRAALVQSPRLGAQHAAAVVLRFRLHATAWGSQVHRVSSCFAESRFVPDRRPLAGPVSPWESGRASPTLPSRALRLTGIDVRLINPPPDRRLGQITLPAHPGERPTRRADQLDGAGQGRRRERPAFVGQARFPEIPRGQTRMCETEHAGEDRCSPLGCIGGGGDADADET